MAQSDPRRGLERRIKRHVISQVHLFFAIVQPGFEKTAAAELQTLGIQSINALSEGGIEFEASLEDCYRLNASARTVTRFIMRIITFKADTFSRFREKIAALPWEFYLYPDSPVRSSITTKKSRLYHSGRLDQELRLGIRERLERHGAPSASPDNAKEQQVFVRLISDRCTISIDTSGQPLYKRGSKPHATQASLRETTAALIMQNAQFHRYDTIIDPMCGSGTFGIEAMEQILRIPPGRNRPYPFMAWPAFRERAFHHIMKTLCAGIVPVRNATATVIMSDIDHDAVKTAQRNCDTAGLSGLCSPFVHDFFRQPLTGIADNNALIVLNPPYGKRLKRKGIEGMYRNIGKAVRTWYGRCGYAIITPGLKYEKILSLPYDRKILFMNGGIRVAVIIRDSFKNI